MMIQTNFTNSKNQSFFDMEKVPEDVLTLIFKNLGIKDIVSCLHVCQRWKRIIERSKIKQYDNPRFLQKFSSLASNIIKQKVPNGSKAPLYLQEGLFVGKKETPPNTLLEGHCPFSETIQFSKNIPYINIPEAVIAINNKFLCIGDPRPAGLLYIFELPSLKPLPSLTNVENSLFQALHLENNTAFTVCSSGTVIPYDLTTGKTLNILSLNQEIHTSVLKNKLVVQTADFSKIIGTNFLTGATNQCTLPPSTGPLQLAIVNNTLCTLANDSNSVTVYNLNTLEPQKTLEASSSTKYKSMIAAEHLLLALHSDGSAVDIWHPKTGHFFGTVKGFNGASWIGYADGKIYSLENEELVIRQPLNSPILAKL